MGDIADMMLEGILCAGCGEFLGDGDGYPEYCDSCSAEEEPEKSKKKRKKSKQKTK